MPCQNYIFVLKKTLKMVCYALHTELLEMRAMERDETEKSEKVR